MNTKYRSSKQWKPTLFTKNIVSIRFEQQHSPLNSRHHEISEVEHRQSTWCGGAKLENEKFCVISGSKCNSTDVSVIANTDTLTDTETYEQMYHDT